MNKRLDPKTTPKFWRKVRNVALVVGAIATTVLTAGTSLPATVVTVATILASASGAVAGTAQLTKE